MNFSSTLQVLKVDTPEERTYDGKTFMVHTAQTALLLDDGTLDKVGRLRIPESMVDKVKVGVFRASFSLEVAQWGKSKGDVIASLVGLDPVPVRKPVTAA